MRIKTTQTKVYKFEELSEEQKEKVLNNLCNINVDYEWYDSTYEDAERIGLKITGFDLDRNRYAKGKFIKSTHEVADLIIKEHGEKCETRIDAENFLKERDKIVEEWPKDDTDVPTDISDF